MSALRAACSFVLAVDNFYERGLRALVNSIHAYHGVRIPIRIYHHNLSREVLVWLHKHPAKPTLTNLSHVPDAHRGMWEVKQQIFAWEILYSRLVFLLDADCVLCSSMDDIFDLAAQGFIVGAKDGSGSIAYDDAYRVYGIQPGETHPYINTGALCFDTIAHWPVVAAWSFAAFHARYSGRVTPLSLPGHGDQGLFNAIVAGLGRSEAVYPLTPEEWCDAWSRGCPRIHAQNIDRTLHVVNEATMFPQRLIHSSGPKWWTEEGRRIQGRQGDKLKIFEYFDGM